MRLAGLAVALASAGGCSHGTSAVARGGAPAAGGAAATVSAADARFMSDMIAHHAQAVLMAAWALDSLRGAGPALRTLAARIDVSQRDEIATMQRWLRARGQPVPAADASPGHAAHGAGHGMPVPGMLSPAQLAELHAARGPAFERLFLSFMIQHHQGAIIMVERLLGTSGAARDGLVFRFAADVHADQTAEIDRMSRMLAAMP
jgi:uncharacterized protein (DUF305 family)